MKRVGFTIVELVIVISIIAILTALTVVGYGAYQKRARAQAATSALISAKEDIESYRFANSQYPPSGSLSGIGINDGNGITYEYTGTTTGYCLTATSTNVSYKMTESGAPTAGGCAGHARDGVAAIVNYAINPDADGALANMFGYAGSPVSGTRTIASDRAHKGTTSVKTVVTGASGQTGVMTRVPDPLTISTGEKVSWSFWFYSTKAGTIVPWMDGTRVAGGTYWGTSAASVSVPANTWTKITGTYTSPFDHNITQIGAYNLAVVSGDTTWADEFMLTRTATQQNYADGNTTDWKWNGTVNNSSSQGPAQ